LAGCAPLRIEGCGGLGSMGGIALVRSKSNG
jgi:hypothetical protein